jgi:hypothetical protein
MLLKAAGRQFLAELCGVEQEMLAQALRSRLRSVGGGSGDRDATSASTASNNSDMEHLRSMAYLSRTNLVCAGLFLGHA